MKKKYLIPDVETCPYVTGFLFCASLSDDGVDSATYQDELIDWN